MIRVLITGCSMHSYDLIRALKDNYDGEEIYVVGINCDDTALLRKGVDAGYVVPRITEESYIPTVIDICEKEKVDVILPFITAELPIMAENRELLESHGVKVSISSMESILASGNKVELAKHYPDLMPKQMICKKPLDFFQFADEIGYPKKPMCCKLPNRCGGLGFCIIDEEKGRDLTIYNKFGMNRYITFDMLLELAKNLNCEKQMVLGYRDALFLNDEFEQYGKVYVATEDGSAGTKGNVIDAIRENGLDAEIIYACGPTPMLRALKAYAAEHGIECWLSLEEKMACGIGACLACVCKSKDIDEHSHVHNKRICKDGPVFAAEEVEL